LFAANRRSFRLLQAMGSVIGTQRLSLSACCSEESPQDPRLSLVVDTQAHAEKKDARSGVQNLIKSGVFLVRASYIESVYYSGSVLPKRQDLPREAVWSKGDGQETPEIVVISYTWLSREHPDPDGFHLKCFAPLLRHYASHRRLDLNDVPVFIDWCALPQSPRSPTEEIVFQRILSSIADWYASPNTQVWLLSAVPEGVAPFEDRGWPTFERALATMIKVPESTLDLGLLRPGWRTWSHVVDVCRAQTKLPNIPSDFAALLSTKKFTQVEDHQTLSRMYAAAFEKYLLSEARFYYAGLAWGDVEVEELIKIMTLCADTLTDMELRANEVGDSGAMALAEAIPLCPSLKRLGLDCNHIGTKGQRAIVESWKRCNKPQFGLDLGEQSARSPEPSRSAATGSTLSPDSGGSHRALERSSASTKSHSGASATEQLNQMLARQAAFEARIENSVARLSDGLVAIAEAVKVRPNRAVRWTVGP